MHSNVGYSTAHLEKKTCIARNNLNKALKSWIAISKCKSPSVLWTALVPQHCLHSWNVLFMFVLFKCSTLKPSSRAVSSYYHSSTGAQKISQIIRGCFPEVAHRTCHHKLAKLCLKSNLPSFGLTIWICRTAAEPVPVILTKCLIFSFYATSSATPAPSRSPFSLMYSWQLFSLVPRWTTLQLPGFVALPFPSLWVSMIPPGFQDVSILFDHFLSTSSINKLPHFLLIWKIKMLIQVGAQK